MVSYDMEMLLFDKFPVILDCQDHVMVCYSKKRLESIKTLPHAKQVLDE